MEVQIGFTISFHSQFKICFVDVDNDVVLWDPELCEDSVLVLAYQLLLDHINFITDRFRIFGIDWLLLDTNVEAKRSILPGFNLLNDKIMLGVWIINFNQVINQTALLRSMFENSTVDTSFPWNIVETLVIWKLLTNLMEMNWQILVSNLHSLWWQNWFKAYINERKDLMDFQ